MKYDIKLPLISYEKFTPTRNSVQLISQLLSSIKGSLFPHQKNWEEFSLSVNANGLTTQAIPVYSEQGVESLVININLTASKIEIRYKNELAEIKLPQNSISAVTNKLVGILESYEINFEKLDEKFYNTDAVQYDFMEAEKLWKLFRQIHFLLLEFRGSTLFETSNINLWPHHFDISVLVFSGKLIDGQNPENWDYSREQMNFGFSSGDENFNQPYIYITAYPFKKELLNHQLPDFAFWHNSDWNGIVVLLNKIAELENPKAELLKLFNKLINLIN